MTEGLYGEKVPPPIPFNFACVRLSVVLCGIPPLVQALYLAFTKNGALSLDTVRRTVNNYYFWSALKNTIALAAVIVPIQVALAVVLALLLNKAFKGRDLAIYALVIPPLTISDVASGLIWYSMLSPPTAFLTSF